MDTEMTRNDDSKLSYTPPVLTDVGALADVTLGSLTGTGDGPPDYGSASS